MPTRISFHVPLSTSKPNFLVAGYWASLGEGNGTSVRQRVPVVQPTAPDTLADLNAAIVILQHLSSTHPSHLADILGRRKRADAAEIYREVGDVPPRQ